LPQIIISRSISTTYPLEWHAVIMTDVRRALRAGRHGREQRKARSAKAHVTLPGEEWKTAGPLPGASGLWERQICGTVLPRQFTVQRTTQQIPVSYVW